MHKKSESPLALATARSRHTGSRISVSIMFYIVIPVHIVSNIGKPKFSLNS